MHRQERTNIMDCFSSKRTRELAFLWKEFLLSIHLDLHALVFQTVNQEQYEDKVKANFAVASGSVTSQTANLSHGEECSLRYAAGYVPFIMLRKYEKCTSDTSVQYIECLSNMAIYSGETDFFKYTGAWIEQINGGSLFEVNDTTYIHTCHSNK